MGHADRLFRFSRLIPALVTAGSAVRDGGQGETWNGPYLFAKSSSGSDDEKRTVRAGRRRRTETKPGERERAEAPRRRREEPRKSPPSGGGAARPPSLPSLPTGGLPGGRSPILLLVVIALVVLCGLPLMLLFGGGDSGDGSSGLGTGPDEALVLPTATRTSEVTQATAEPTVPFVAPSTSADGQTWLIMLYQDADDKVLEQDIYVDLNEAERVGSTDRVQIVSQVDRYQAGYQGDGNWSNTRRYFITQDGDLQRVGSSQIQDVGEANMADGQTLVDFVVWAVENFPADKHVLIMADHGMGWPGGWSDPAPGGPGDASIPLASRLGDQLYLMELDEALQEIRDRTGIEAFELIGMDACLMGHLEVFSALAPHARYAVASQETEPALGWAYTGFLQDLVANPDMDGAELGRRIVDTYIETDQRIVDDQARAEMLRQSSPLSGLFGMLGGMTGGMSAEQLSRQMGENVTLAAVDLQALPGMIEAVNDLALSMQGANQKPVAQARSYAQSFTSIFGSEVPPSYIDLGHFAQLLKQESGDADVDRAADAVLAEINRTILAEKHGPKKPGATGISIYFPNSALYQNPLTGPESYTAIARRFADVSLWDDFLAYHYTGQPFDETTNRLAVPERGTAVQSPAGGGLDVSPLSLSDDVAAPGQPILLSVDIAGENVGYVYLFVGLYDRDANAIFVADSDYLESESTKEIDGVYYPDWGEGAFTMEFEWEPIVFAIDDGVDSVVALFTPATYGATFEEAVYTVDGIYTYADGGESRHARLYFSDGLMRQVFGFTGEDGTGAPREILPQAGDAFTVLEKWLDLDERGNVVGAARQEGGTLTFGDQTFTWQDLDAPAGDYLVGFVVEDLDGNAVQVYEEVTVR